MRAASRAASVLAKHGEKPREFRNRVLFLAPDSSAVQALKDHVRRFLGDVVIRPGDRQDEEAEKEDRLAQVMRNLLANALRHTEAGTVTVACEAVAGRARVEVRDTGEGIPEADLPYIFERFYRADAARARDTGGSGIGLAVSRRIVEDHRGSVFARAGEGGGAVVGFEIPLGD